jgi:hypothetical protein
LPSTSLKGIKVSGRKQHFIPQALQKSFKAAKGKKAQVYVFRKGQAPYLSSTEGVAAQRDFYSEPSDAQTLDDKITDYENAVLAPAVAALRESPAGPIEAHVAAAVVVHLSIRSAFVRGALSAAATEFLEHFADALRSHETTRALLEVDSLKSESMLVKTIEEEIQSRFHEWPDSGKNTFSKLMHFRAREKFPQMFPGLAAAVLQQFEMLLERMPEMIVSGHSKALEKDLVPALRVERLKAMNWQIIAAEAETHFVLPDCLALGSKSADFQGLEPYSLLGDEELAGVVMPVSSGKVLVGCFGNPELDASSLNRSFAQCSLEFFISSKADAATSEAAQLIGSMVSEYVGKLVEDQGFTPPNRTESEQPESESKDSELVKVAVKFEPSSRKSGKAQAAVRNLLSGAELQDGLRFVESVVVTDDVVRSLRQRGVPLNDQTAQAAKLGTCHTVETPQGVTCQLFVPTELVNAVVKGHQVARAAAGLIRHQAGRATYIASLVRRVPMETLQRPRPLLETVGLRIAQFFSSHYFGGRLSGLADLSDAEFAATEALYSQALVAGMQEIERARRHFIEHRDVNAALTHALMHVELLLSATASACATTAGQMGRWKDSNSIQALRAVSLDEWFELFARDLERYFDSRGRWTGDDELLLLGGHIERVLWSFGIVLSTKVAEEIWMEAVTDEQLVNIRAMLRAYVRDRQPIQDRVTAVKRLAFIFFR